MYIRKQMLSWIVGYLFMDAVYVVLSRSFYINHIKKVSGSSPENFVKVALCALGAYLLMALGWSKIVAPNVQKGKVIHALQVGATYGLVLYGVFNFTTGAMFDKWGYDVMLRDTMWGTSSIALYTALYAAISARK
jgi:uncharacterized membrane protein